jgi:ATP-binding cassette subfamily F protein uup
VQTTTSHQYWIQAESITYRTPSGELLFSDLTFSIGPNRSVEICGANGTGKSTLLRLCLGMIPVASGSLARGLRKEEIEFLPQMQNTGIHLPMTLGDVIYRTSQISPDPAEVENLGLLRVRDLSKAWNSSSGGERQKALLTRALLSPAKLLILDEPLNHLDESTRSLLKKIILRSSGQERAFVLVSHEPIIADESGRQLIRLGA